MNIYTSKSDSHTPPIPLIGSVVKAGFPSPADDYIEAQLNLHDELVEHPASTFFIKVSGDSMIDAGIKDGDTLVIDRSLTVKNGDIVLAILNGEFTVKTFTKNASEVVLVPGNPHYPKIHLQEGDDFEVWGIVTYSVSDLRKP